MMASALAPSHTRLEIVIARNARHLVDTRRYARLTQNPVLASTEDLRDARLHFADHCAICHGNDGTGDTLIGSGLYPKPPDICVCRKRKILLTASLFWIIENGVRFTGNAFLCKRRGAWRHTGKLEAGSLHSPPSASHGRGTHRDGAL